MLTFTSSRPIQSICKAHHTVFSPRSKLRFRMASSAKKKPRVGDQSLSEYGSPASMSEAGYAVPGLMLNDNKIRVPLDYSGQLEGSIEVFYRVAVHRNKLGDKNLPYLLYLQGGPGFEAPRPMDCSGWLKSAVNYFRVVLMDQRGTGLSAGITAAGLERQGTPEAQAQYLKCFRADSIVRDAEAVRAALLPPGSRDTRWSLLGQSFGGFCCVSYLSMAPAGLAEVLIAGGLPPGITSSCAADDVYRHTFRRVLQQNCKFYSRFPDAEGRARAVVAHLAAQPGGGITTPSGNLLSPRSFQLLGLHTLGFAHGFERLHYMLESAFDPSTGTLSHRFLKEFDSTMAWDSNPLYALLHESIYCQGAPSRWAAHRVRGEAAYASQFDAVAAAAEGRRVMFTGEMVFPWMFDEFKELKRVKQAAELVAAEEAWPGLYDPHQLAGNAVPVAAVSYYEDMFVDFELAEETGGGIAGLRRLVTNEWLHDGIRENGAALFEKLLSMARGGILVR